MSELKAILFDCDGVIAETEKDGHRIAFNRAFQQMKLPIVWDEAEYGELLKISGGKERMKAYFNNHPDLVKRFGLDDDAVQKLHKIKTEIFMNMSACGDLPIRPGVRRLAKEAYDKGILLAVCSTSNVKSVTSLMKAVLGEEGFKWFHDIFAGDIVKAKKPAPDIYNLAIDAWKLHPEECFVIEDTRNGLLAAKAAGMHCLVTVSHYSKDENFKEADLVVSSLGEPDSEPIHIYQSNEKLAYKPHHITLEELRRMV